MPQKCGFYNLRCHCLYLFFHRRSHSTARFTLRSRAELKMSDRNVSKGHDGKADMAYGKCPSKIKKKIAVPDQLFIEPLL